MGPAATRRSLVRGFLNFARCLQEEFAAKRVYLFGPRLRGDLQPDTDSDFIVVAHRFEGVQTSERGRDLYRLWRSSGGVGPIHAVCLTTEEFEYARSHPTFVQAVLRESIDLLEDNASSALAQIKPARAPVFDSIEPALRGLAERLRDECGAERVLLFGSRARGTAAQESDSDLIVVSDRFAAIPQLERGRGFGALFAAVGGRTPLDLLCLTPEEFEDARTRITLVSAVLPEAIDLLRREEVTTSQRASGA